MEHDPAGRARAEARLQALVAATSDVVYVMNADWSQMQPIDGRNLVAGNDAPISDWMQRNLPAEEHARVKAGIAHAIATRTPFEMEHRVIAPDGSIGWTHSRAVPILGARGEILEWFGLARDVTGARRAADALRHEEQRFRAVFEQSTAGIAQVDPGGRFVLVNDRFCEIVGRSRAQLFELRMQDVTHPDDAPGNLALLAQVVGGQIDAFTIQKRYVRPDGDTVWVQNAVSATRGADGHLQYITAVVADISRLHEAEERLAAFASQRQLALDAARLGWWQFDPATGQVSHDARYAEIYGLHNHDPRAVADISPLLHPEDAPRVWAAVESALQRSDGRPYAVEYRIVRPDGELRWLEARGITTLAGRGEERRVVDFVGTVADVTERRLADEVLRANEARFRLMADASPAVLWLTDPDGHCTFLSRRWYESTGQTEDEALGLGWTAATHPDDQASAGEAFLAANRERRFFRGEYRLRQADGSYRWAVDLGRPWFSETGQYAGMVGAVFDIDDRKRAEQDLQEANRRKDQFLATLAHELRNPIAPVSNALQVWPRIEDKPEEVARLRAMMTRQVRQMLRLIDDLLDVSRITRGRIELRRERVDLRELLATAVETLRPQIEARRHAVALDLPPAPVVADADAGRLAQVFGNLLDNAAKYTPPGGHLALSLAREDGEAVVRVRDDGVGIPPALLGEVFEVFMQVDQTLARSHGGLGIGLTLVRSLVELHGGRVEARSEGPDRGTEVVVRLPLSPDDALAAGPAPAAPLPPLARRRVLVVDDVEASAETLALMLQGLGQETRTAHDGPAALAAAAAYQPEVAFVDIAMPGMDGFEVARRLRAAPGPAPRLVALTGFGSEEDRRRSLAAGFDDHLVKPTTVEHLHAVLAHSSKLSPKIP